MSSDSLHTTVGRADRNARSLNDPDSSEDSNLSQQLSSSEESESPSQAPADVRERVDTATSNPLLTGKRCLIRNIDEVNAVEYVYCLPRESPESLKTMLEFWWNMDRESLYIDTRYNIFRLNASMRALFDHGKWFLLPEPRIIEQYFETRGDRDKFPIIEEDTYTYTFFAHPDMRRVPIHRQVTHPSEWTHVKASDFTFLGFPFAEFTVISHTHPKFVICNAGQKLTTDENDIAYKGAHPGSADLFDKVAAIYRAWTSPVDRAANEAFFQDGSDDHGENNTA
ncbi:hypothetical protein BD779DRAFT_1547656 [Infundibulicybe gibba]|nr:hypothetical protein BD779DRAFT_1547656 [Infundibulicybe gibba]